MQKVGITYNRPEIYREDAKKIDVFTPDFSNDDVLYEDGELNDISVMQNKPRYRALIESQQRHFDSVHSPDLPDEVLAGSMISSDLDMNELCAQMHSDMNKVLNAS